MLPFLGVTRRVRRWGFVLFVAAAVYAGPRFANDMYNHVRGTTTTTTSIP